MGEQRTWRKSSYTGAENACVELSVTPEDTAIRDTKDRDGGTLTVPAQGFAALLAGLRV